MTTLAFLGDVMLGRGVKDEIRHVSPESIWGTTLPVLRQADAVIANLECAMTSHTTRWSHTPKMFHFRADPAAVEALRAANVRCVSLANNHSLDFEEKGLLDTLAHLDAAGIAHAGAGQNLARAQAPAIVRLPELTLGIVAMTDNEPAFAATPRVAGTSYINIASGPPPGIALAGLASSCRERGADLAVLSLHWGPNMVTEPPQPFREFARAAIEAGFDLIHGHSAHLFQGVELYRGRPIFYDTGDFIDDYAVDRDLRNDWSFIFLVDVTRKQIERVRLIPVRLQYARVDLATRAEAEAICRRMTKMCAALGTRITSANERIEIACDETKRRGHVGSLAEKERAEQIACRVEGVRAIANDLEVVVEPQLSHDDSALVAAAADILAGHPLVPRDRIDISVSNGWLTVSGEVEWEWQRGEAEDALRTMIGLRGLTSRIVARPHAPVRS